MKIKVQTSVFMKDGAMQDTALCTQEFLKQAVGNQIIGKHVKKSWHLYSSDSTPADF